MPPIHGRLEKDLETVFRQLKDRELKTADEECGAGWFTNLQAYWLIM